MAQWGPTMGNRSCMACVHSAPRDATSRLRVNVVGRSWAPRFVCGTMGHMSRVGHAGCVDHHVLQRHVGVVRGVDADDGVAIVEDAVHLRRDPSASATSGRPATQRPANGSRRGRSVPATLPAAKRSFTWAPLPRGVSVTTASADAMYPSICRPRAASSANRARRRHVQLRRVALVSATSSVATWSQIE